MAEREREKGRERERERERELASEVYIMLIIAMHRRVGFSVCMHVFLLTGEKEIGKKNSAEGEEEKKV